MNYRTDLAAEIKTDVNQKTGGVAASREKYGEIDVTTIEVQNEIGERLLGKPVGKYICFTLPPFLEPTDEMMAQKIISVRLRSLFPKKTETVLVVGLGNREITPDALGPQTAGRILATRHLRRELSENDPDTSFLRGLRPVSVLANGVLGQTGIETAELIAALRETVKPACIVAIDALACSDLNRLGTTVQISDAGIAPGSGVRNSRTELSRSTLGVPVIGVGVPTVVDLHTIVRQAAGHAPDGLRTLPNLMVTPRDIDRILHHAARLIACALNLALHPQLSFADAESL